MKRIFIKISILALLSLLFMTLSYCIDTFNIFHWNNIRITKAEPNKNYVKSKYILANPQKFNAFAFGSSRIGNLDLENLPKELNGVHLNWYNMTYSQGIPSEHLQNIKTFLKNGIEIKWIILEFDDITMYCNPEKHKNELLRNPYESSIENPVSFYLSYLKKPEFSLIKDILMQNKKAEKERDLFYKQGQFLTNIDFSLPETVDEKKFLTYSQLKIKPASSPYKYKGGIDDILGIIELCKENNIQLTIFTTPIFCETFKQAVDFGYLDFLHDVAEKCSFYNFSEINQFTTDRHYYFENSHYRPALGRIISKTLFGTEEEKREIAAIVSTFGQLVDNSNIDEIISQLKNQLSL